MRAVHSFRIVGLMTVALLLLGMPAPAGAGTSLEAPAAPGAPVGGLPSDSGLSGDVPMPRDLVSRPSNYQISAVALGAVVGAIVGNLVTGGLMTPVLTGGYAVSATAAAAPTAAAYLGGLLGTIVGSGLGAYVGSWLTASH